MCYNQYYDQLEMFEDDFNLESHKTKKLKIQVDRQMLQQRPIVFHGKSVYVFVDKCSKIVNKFLRDVCDPISKPQKVHEYDISKQSLVRAQALGYKKDQIIKTFKRNMQNEGEIPIEVQRKINQFVRESQCQLFLWWTGEQCKYIFKIDKQLYQNVRLGIDNLITPSKLIPSDGQTLYFEVLKFKHTELQQNLLKHCMPAKADRQVEAYVPLGNKLKSTAKHAAYCHNIQINLKSFTELRQYQAQALNAVIRIENQTIRAKSGYIVLPCGAGKTLLGISILCKIKKETLIVCSSDSGTQQWKRQIQKWTQSFPREHIIIITSQNKFQFKNSQHGQIFISTYSFLKTHINVKKQIKKADQWLVMKPWGLVIFDECQTLPATQNRQIVQTLSAQVKIGLTATPLRQDDQIKGLNYMIGPQLYVGDWKTFVEQGYLANPKCIEIRTQLTPFFRQKYRRYSEAPTNETKQKRSICYKINPNKIKALLYLLHHHENLEQPDQILVFSDDISILNYLAKRLKKPVLAGSAKPEQRMFIFDMFRQGKIKTLFLSRIGDEAIDLPNANVGIQINIQHGSRKQMLQRLGRIMRQKQASSSSSYNAVFYTITTYDTLEWTYFFKRYKCLINQGFHYDLRLFEFRPKQIDEIENIMQLDHEVRQKIDDKYKQVIDNEQAYWDFLSKSVKSDGTQL